MTDIDWVDDRRSNLRKWGDIRWDNLQKRFDLNFIEEKNSIIRFSLNGIEYYFTKVKQKVRAKGEKEWTSKVVTFLKSRMHNKIPARMFDPESVNIMPFGKHKGKSIETIIRIDKQYLIWLQNACIENPSEGSTETLQLIEPYLI